MIPSTKRKATDDTNPLLTAAKKAKPSKSNNKRKLLHGEEQPGGLMIVREPTATVQENKQAPASKSSTVAGPSHPPAKKFKASSSTNPTPAATDDVERDVRDMVDESNDLRQKSKSRQQTAGSTSFKMPERSGMTTPARKRGKTKDETLPLHTAETPQIQKNKQLRGELDSPLSDVGSSGGKKGHRRRSSNSGRGKRISDAFEASGIIVQPHNSIAPSSYHKHIDPDEPEQDRLRQLLIWCSSRASSSSCPEPSKPLPQLSDNLTEILKDTQGAVIKMLAEKELLGVKSPSKASASSQPQENEQNRLNRIREVRFTQEIESHEAEQDGWTRRQAMYDQWFKQEQAIINKRQAELAGDLPPPTPSAKAKGKRKATESGAEHQTDEEDLPQLDLLDDQLRSGVSLAMSILGIRGEHRLPGWKTRVERQEQLDGLVTDMEFKLDTLHNYTNSARSTASIAERTLDQRFALLSAILTARANPFPTPAPARPDPTSETGSATELLSTYVPKAGHSRPDSQQLFKALAGIDSQRPAAKVGDAARRAQKEVQRAEEVGAGILSERKLTTPRKAHGTPRRAVTPSRERK